MFEYTQYKLRRLGTGEFENPVKILLTYSHTTREFVIYKL